MPLSLAVQTLDADLPTWHVARYHAWKGDDAVASCRAAGFQAHWPRVAVRQPRADPKISPLWTPYFAVAFDAKNDPWGPLLHARGIAGILSDQHGQPYTLPAGYIEALIESVGGVDGVEMPPPVHVKARMHPAKRRFMSLVDAQDPLAGLMRALGAPRTLAEQLDRDNPVIIAAGAV